ncbi:MAG TPA: DUF5368 domain-containing protein [Rhodocyclaceae bacterium]|nr:DUF5368 domain-containing protein [Rhodocyclaceae bacterium]
MKELDPMILLAVFQEMLGALLWVLLATAVGGIVAFIALIVRERRIVSRRLVRAELAGLVGGALSLVLMAKVSSSGFTDAGGPADWFLIALVFGAGLVGTTIIGYAAAGWLVQLARGATATQASPPVANRAAAMPPAQEHGNTVVTAMARRAKGEDRTVATEH